TDRAAGAVEPAAHAAIHVETRVAALGGVEDAEAGAEGPVVIGAIGYTEARREVVEVVVDQTITVASVANRVDRHVHAADVCDVAELASFVEVADAGTDGHGVRRRIGIVGNVRELRQNGVHLGFGAVLVRLEPLPAKADVHGQFG